MNVAAGPKLAAAVTNAGGLGVIGGVRAIAFASPEFFLMYDHRLATLQTCFESRLQN